MSTRADPASSSAASSLAPQRKPRFALLVATVCGLGYFPKAPGTWGSLAGVAFAIILGHFRQLLFSLLLFFGSHQFLGIGIDMSMLSGKYSSRIDPNLIVSAFAALLVAAVGVWASGRVARFARLTDPQFVVIDEVSGQHLTYLLSFAPLNWKYLLLGFILFRVFDIWKPFPVRQAESLRGGWGIMADDWVAAVYSALGLWIAKSLGL